MKVLHIAEVIEGASGIATFVRELNSALNANGVESRIVCARDGFYQCVMGLLDSDIVHIHGLWLPFFHRTAEWAYAHGIPIVWSTHGMTAPWAMHHKWWKKRLAWRLYQRGDLKRAALIHCTTELEMEWNKRLGFGNCFIAPLGAAEFSTQRHGGTEERQIRTLLFVGRIHPVKGLENLIEAWGMVVRSAECGVQSAECEVRSWRLKIVGPDEGGYLSRLKALVQSLELQDSVEFAGPKFGDDLSREYENCNCLILPSFTENFGATIIDALAHGKPCIASTFTPWKELQDRDCGWWVDNELSILARAIREMIEAGDGRRREMGAHGYSLVKEKYTWPAVARAVSAKYAEILNSR